jgi:XTP/dITP diphosphohydrolase
MFQSMSSRTSRALILLSKNEFKLRELFPLFQKHDILLESSPIEKIEVRSDDVEIVAREAVKHAFSLLKKPVVVDDTGLYIECLNGFPRAYPAFVLDTIGKAGVLTLMRDTENRRAFFVTAVGYCDENGPLTFIGKTEGVIAECERGTGGFGYDPIFIPDGFNRTYAELSFDQKIAISHRTKAFNKFLVWYAQAK